MLKWEYVLKIKKFRKPFFERSSKRCCSIFDTKSKLFLVIQGETVHNAELSLNFTFFFFILSFVILSGFVQRKARVLLTVVTYLMTGYVFFSSKCVMQWVETIMTKHVIKGPWIPSQAVHRAYVIGLRNIAYENVSMNHGPWFK